MLGRPIDRVRRLGHTRGVQVINFVALGTIAEGMLSALTFKQSLFAGARGDDNAQDTRRLAATSDAACDSDADRRETAQITAGTEQPAPAAGQTAQPVRGRRCW